MGLLDDFIFWMSPKRVVDGIPVAVLLVSSDEEREAAFFKIDAAMRLIATYAPIRRQQVLRDVRRILVCGEPTARGAFLSGSRTCDLFFDWLLSAETTPQEVAATIVHEAQHGRLLRLGFGYGPDKRHRVERICYRATRAFARRIPAGDGLIERAEAGMSLDADACSDAAYFERCAQVVGRLKLPHWYTAALSKVLKWRARRAVRRRSRTQPERRK